MPLDRFRVYGGLDDTPLSDGDPAWTGFYSRYQPTYLKPGQLSYSGNGRMDRGTFKVRKGLKSLSNSITLTDPPLIVGAFSLANDVAVTSITRSVATATVTTTSAHGYTSNNRVNIRGAVQTEYNGDFTITVTDTTHFTYTVSGTPASPATGTIYANKGPRVYNVYNNSVFASGDYAATNGNVEGIIIALNGTSYLYRYGQSILEITYPSGETVASTDEVCIVQFLDVVYMFRGYQTANPIAVTSLNRSTTTATVVTTAAHGLSTNDWVTMTGAAQYQYNGIFQITVSDATTFTFTCLNSGASPATGTLTARPCKPPLVWNEDTSGSPAWTVVTTGSYGAPTLLRMPAVDWGMYFKGRFILPYARDQIILSDVFDANTYDPSQTQFRILPGTNDWIVAAFPYQEAKLLVLYHKSVHLVLLDGSNLSYAQAVEVTRNIGCTSRRTVVNCGPYIVWLSDKGVVRLQIGLELSLTNTAAPMSDPIQDIIERVNWPYADVATATFFNNRYYLALPLDDNTTNNCILVYNFLNEAWESVDVYPGGFALLNFHLIDYNNSTRLHAVSTNGFVSLMEENEEDEFGAPGSLMDYVIAGQLNTRNYLAGSYDAKKVKRFQLEANVDDATSFTGDWVFSNPDSTIAVLNESYTADNDVSIRRTVNRRGTSGRLEITTTGGRPEFKAITIEAATTTRGTYSLP